MPIESTAMGVNRSVVAKDAFRGRSRCEFVRLKAVNLTNSSVPRSRTDDISLEVARNRGDDKGRTGLATFVGKP